MKLILIGYMGSGKSTLGHALAEVTKLPFSDLDAVIEEQEAMTIAELFKTKGEIYFRKKEAEYLSKLINAPDNQILALGGGTPCYGNIMEMLCSHPNVKTVYLKGGVDLLTDRLWDERAKRPLIAHIESKDVLNDFIRKHLFERTYFYNQADRILDIGELSLSELTERIVFELF